MTDEIPKPTIHKIGCTRSIQSAVLVCEYLREHCGVPHSSIHGDRIRYSFTDPTDRNGWWSADIFVETYGYDVETDKALSRMVDLCRAFVAGRGEIW